MFYSDEQILGLSQHSDIIERFQDMGIDEKIILLALLNMDTVTDELLLSKIYDINIGRLVSDTFFDEVHSMDLSMHTVRLKAETYLRCATCVSRATILYLPCGHISLCEPCFKKNNYNSCNICKTPFTETHNVYL